ncbi:K02A2.6-like [Cordylochernes scorpioides]|uniref:RNA-directed DNA polymerase n=1 Tax=Cordylochernes scorpioides TaxID=51811 RepID=A0ABY6K5L3_9ARAC|nr:K02A2.6-like [Cordylochernes scorpioides]
MTKLMDDLIAEDDPNLDNLQQQIIRKFKPRMNNSSIIIIEEEEIMNIISNSDVKKAPDHSALDWLFNIKKPKVKFLRWIVELLTKSMKIVHRSGSKQTHVDALSRPPVSFHISIPNLRLHQQNADLSFVKLHQDFIMVKPNGVLKAVVPESFQEEILKECHDIHFHPSINKTVRLITPFYWWPNAIKCIKEKMEQGREEDSKEPMKTDPDYESGENTTFPKKENTLGRTQEIVPSQEDATPPPPVSDVLGRLTTTLHQLSAVTGLSRDVELPRYDAFVLHRLQTLLGVQDLSPTALALLPDSLPAWNYLVHLSNLSSP